MVNKDELGPLLDEGVVYDPAGEKVGKIAQVYLDDRSGEPKWVSVNTGLFGTNESFVPLQGATVADGELRVGYTKDTIKDAPNVDADHHLSHEEEAGLFRHYGLTPSPTSPDRTGQDYSTGQDPRDSRAGEHESDSPAAGVGRDVSGPNTDEAMTRSEEQLSVHTEQHEAGRARLRKYVVTENVTTTVPVQREEVRLEREPITEENRDQARTGGDLTEEEHVVTLNEERVVVDKETVPVERVRLDKDVVTDQQEVSEDVRKEQIEADLPEGERSNRPDVDR